MSSLSTRSGAAVWECLLEGQQFDAGIIHHEGKELDVNRKVKDLVWRLVLAFVGKFSWQINCLPCLLVLYAGVGC